MINIILPENNQPPAIPYKDLHFDGKMVYHVLNHHDMQKCYAVWDSVFGSHMVFFSECGVEIMTDKQLQDDDYSSLLFVETSLEMNINFNA